MARTVDPRVAPTGRWQALVSQLAAQHAGLPLYQWLWIALCMVGALAVATPRVILQPVIFYANAETRFELERYGGLYVGGKPGHDFQIAITDATEALRQKLLERREVRFGLPNFQVVYLPQEPGYVLVRGVAPTAAEALALANAGAEELVRQVRAAGGREILRNLMGWELWLALEPEGIPALAPFDELMRAIVRLQAFPMSLPLEPFSDPRSVEALPLEEQRDLTRALEARYDLWRFAINTRNATLDAFCLTPGGLTTGQREAHLGRCAMTDERAARERAERDREIERLRAIEAALTFMVRERSVSFTPDGQSVAFRVPAALPSAPEPRYIPQLIVLAGVVGLAFGLSGVAVDRSIGVADRVRALWKYRELMRNLVLRDLRARYKGSALGYLWTQFAPLLMMLVFVFVFGTLFPSGIALYAVFMIAGLLPWNYCAESVSGGTRSIIDNAALIKKVYFPREVLPLVSIGSSLVNYMLSLPMMFLVMAAVQLFSLGRLNLAWSIFYLPVLMLIQTIFLSGIALFLSSLAVFFRDIVHLIGILINFWFFLTPVFYSLDMVSSGLAARTVRWLNPMASLIEFYREILYGNTVPVGQIPTPAFPALSAVLRVALTALVVFVAGYWFFQRTSGRFGEEV